MSKVDYGPLSEGDYFAGKCGYIDICPDIKKLRESERNGGKPDEGLIDQFVHLCSVGGRCSIKGNLEKEAEETF